MRQHKYIFRDGEPQECPDLGEWSAFMECCETRIAWTTVGEIKVSTVFLPIDHSWRSETPILFETMLFAAEGQKLPPGVRDHECHRYATLAKAKRGHEITVERVREFFPEAKVTTEKFPTGNLRPDRAADYEGIRDRVNKAVEETGGELFD